MTSNKTVTASREETTTGNKEETEAVGVGEAPPLEEQEGIAVNALRRMCRRTNPVKPEKTPTRFRYMEKSKNLNKFKEPLKPLATGFRGFLYQIAQHIKLSLGQIRLIRINRIGLN